MIIKNETLLDEIEMLQKMKKEADDHREDMKMLKNKNARLKLEVKGYQFKDRMIKWVIIVCVVVAVGIFVVGGKKE